MSEEKYAISIDRSTEVVSLILRTAEYNAKWHPAVTADYVRDAANLVFLALDLVQKRIKAD